MVLGVVLTCTVFFFWTKGQHTFVCLSSKTFLSLEAVQGFTCSTVYSKNELCLLLAKLATPSGVWKTEITRLF